MAKNPYEEGCLSRMEAPMMLSSRASLAASEGDGITDTPGAVIERMAVWTPILEAKA